MDFTFDPEQLAFRDAVHKLMLIEAAPEMLREIWETESGRSRELRRKFAEQGLTALSVPEAYGGMGLGDLDWALMTHEFGYYAIPDSLTDTAYVAAALLSQLPDAAPLKQEWLPRIAEGEVRVGVGHPVNPLVADAHLADLLLMWHEGEVHALRPGQFDARLNQSIDLSRRLYRVSWKPMPATRVCAGDAGAAVWAQVFERGALAAAGQLIGLAQRMLDLGVDYAAQRKQFGKPIGAFQGVKHHLADVAVKIEFAKPALYRAAYALDHGESGAPVLVSHAKLAGAEAALLAARKSIQVHGAIGYTWDADLQMFMKRAWALDAAWGDRAHHKARVASVILDENAVAGPGTTFA
jgi:alkylation response protein AidB-like acyl-CoA dehydrogenase